MRDKLTTVLELAGLGAVTTGAALIDPAAGFIVGGLLAVVVGALLDWPTRKEDA